jgi:hypothetical protein
MKKLCILTVLLTGACTTPMLGAGSTVALLGATPASATYEYTRAYGTEFQAALNFAQAHCQQYGKNAQAGPTNPSGWNTIDRVATTFSCVNP